MHIPEYLSRQDTKFDSSGVAIVKIFKFNALGAGKFALDVHDYEAILVESQYLESHILSCIILFGRKQIKPLMLNSPFLINEIISSRNSVALNSRRYAANRVILHTEDYAFFPTHVKNELKRNAIHVHTTDFNLLKGNLIVMFGNISQGGLTDFDGVPMVAVDGEKVGFYIDSSCANYCNVHKLDFSGAQLQRICIPCN